MEDIIADNQTTDDISDTNSAEDNFDTSTDIIFHLAVMFLMHSIFSVLILHQCQIILMKWGTVLKKLKTL